MVRFESDSTNIIMQDLLPNRYKTSKNVVAVLTIQVKNADWIRKSLRSIYYHNNSVVDHHND